MSSSPIASGVACSETTLDDLLQANLVGYRRATGRMSVLVEDDEPKDAYIFNDVAMITDEEESATVGHIDLHADQAFENQFWPHSRVVIHTVCVAWQMVQCNTLTEVEGAVIEGFPVARCCQRPF